jgi:hypothetical protein
MKLKLPKLKLPKLKIPKLKMPRFEFLRAIDWEPISRVTLGALLLIFGLNGIMNWIPLPEMNPRGVDFMMAMSNTGYMLLFIKMVEIACGSLLLINKYAKLSLLVAAPVVLNILAFHFFLDWSGMSMALLLTGLLAHGVWIRRDAYRVLLD